MLGNVILGIASGLMVSTCLVLATPENLFDPIRLLAGYCTGGLGGMILSALLPQFSARA